MPDLIQTYDPFSPEVMADPVPFYRQLREASPVHYLPQYDTWVVTRFQDVWDVLGENTGAFLSTEGSLPSPVQLKHHNHGALPDPPTNPIGNANSFGTPVYENFRHAQGKPLRPASVARLETEVRALARERLDELIPRGRFDLTQEYGGYVAAGMVCLLLGLGKDETRHVLDIVNSSTTTHDSAAERGLDLATLLERALALITPAVTRQREQFERDGTTEGPVLSGMFSFSFQGRPLSDAEVARNLICIFVGGTETVPKITGHGLWELQRHPEQLAAIREDLHGNLAIAREEIFRYCAPAQWFARTVRNPIEIGGVEMRPGQRVFSVIASALRDDREFDDPESFQWDRVIPRQLAFGRGQHFCIGFHLARLEVLVLMEEFLTRVHDYRIDPATAVRHPSSFQWGYNSLFVEVGA